MVDFFDSNTFRYIVIVISLILIIFLLWLHHYLFQNKDIYNSMVFVKSDKLITQDYTLYSPYYLSYDDIDVSLFNNKFKFIYSLNSSCDISYGREIRYDFEILLSNKYNNLVGNRIPLFINGDRYYFLVVGTYHNINPFYNKYIYMSESSLKYLYSLYEHDIFNYTFIFDDYNDLNKDIDYLKEEGFSMVIPYTNVVERMDNYNVYNTGVVLGVFDLISVIVLFLYHIFYSE